jgi:hypothetical protein
MHFSLSDGIAVLAFLLSCFCIWQYIRLRKLGKRLSATERRTEVIIKLDYKRRNLEFLGHQLNGIYSWFKRHGELSKSMQEDQGAERPGGEFQAIPSLESMVLKIDAMLEAYDAVRDQLFTLPDTWDEDDFDLVVPNAERLITESGDVESYSRRLLKELERLIKEHDERA